MKIEDALGYSNVSAQARCTALLPGNFTNADLKLLLLLLSK